MARPTSSYRGARRNAARAAHVLRNWRDHAARGVVEVHVRSGKYTGDKLRLIRARKGVGRPPQKAAA